MGATLLIIERKEQILSLIYRDNRLINIKVYDKNLYLNAEDNGAQSSQEFNVNIALDSIYIGKVKNVVPSIDGAFIEICNGVMGFLPMKHAKNPIITNRKYDGRILAGDEVLVQIEKDGIKTKALGLTCNLSFSGKYCVLTTGKPGIGFSSKLENKVKIVWKHKLEEWKIDDVLQRENVGLIIRTNVSGLSLDDVSSKTKKLSETVKENQKTDSPGDSVFKKEFEELLKQKNKVLDTVSYRTCFSCIFKPLEGYLKDIRDSHEECLEKIITNNIGIYERICEVFPEADNVEFYQDTKITLEKLYSVETRLHEVLQERVWLNSGAYLVIQQTEALTVIDVNSGKIQKKNPIDDIYHTINKEAAREIALQLKLRNLSGIIIIDFINQNSKEQDKDLLVYLSSLVKKDSVKTNVVDMTPLGLVELTRKKISKSLKEQLR